MYVLSRGDQVRLEVVTFVVSRGEGDGAGQWEEPGACEADEAVEGIGVLGGGTAVEHLVELGEVGLG